MKPRPSSLFSAAKSFGFIAAVAGALLFSYSAQAANGTWTGATNNDWQTTTNWNPNTTPGSITFGSFASTETATFSTAGSGSLNLGDFINIRTVLFGVTGGNAGAFTIGDSNDTLNLSNAGTVNVAGGVSSNQAVGVAGTLIGLTSTNAGATASFVNNGWGTLMVAGAVSNVTGVGNTATTLTLGGISNGTVTGTMSSSGTLGAAGLKLVQNGDGGTWTLSGANTFTGGITIGAGSSNGGTLVLDYATNATVVAATNTITFGGGGGSGFGGAGTLYIKGAGTGTTAQTLGSLTLASGSGQSRIVVDNNGGSGTTLTLGNTWTRSAGGMMLFDVSQGGTINSNTTSVNNGVVSSTTTLAPYFIKTATVTDFVKLTAGSLAPLGATTQLGTSGGTTSDHRLLSNTGTHTLTGATTADTLRVDTSTGGGILDLVANNLTLNKQNIIFDGTGSYTINGTTGSIVNAFYSQFSTGTVTINSRVTGAVTKLGSGLLVANFGNALTGNGVNLYNGVYRAANTNSVPTTGNINLNSSGIFELTTASGDITKNVGNGGSSQVNFQGSGGFSAFDSNRVVAFGGTVSPTAVTWGPGQTTGFLGDGAKLILGSAYSGFTLDFRNAVNLNGSQRLVEVNDGSSATNVDGLLSGVISGTGNSGLTKAGTGTLSLTNVNTYSGATNVSAGRLLVNNTTGSGTGTGPVNVASGATLGGTGMISGAVNVSGVLSPGASIETLGSGALTLNNGSTFAYEIDSSVGLGVGADLQKVTGDLALDGLVTLTLDDLALTDIAFGAGTTFSLINYTGSWNSGRFTYSGNLLDNNEQFTAGLNTWQIVYNAATGGSNFTGEYFGGTDSFVNITAVPEPDAAMLVGALGMLVLLRRRRND